MKEEERGYERNNNKLVFGVNGERFEVSLSGGTVDPSTTLLRFLHYQTRFKSVKLGCGEVLFRGLLKLALLKGGGDDLIRR
ncbi:hypothetical protein QYF36_008919 [Acer negundo]|nr:hypothetical protein QYF36_008919 [Acer negundo]